jgi:dCMP deaminase
MDETLLQVAYVMAQRGTCPTAKVGAIFAIEGRILTTGYNGAPPGMLHCAHEPADWTDLDAPPCHVAVHAEANAIAFAARNGVGLGDSTAYCTLTPCVTCAQLMLSAGVVRLVAGDVYRDGAGATLLHEAGVGVELMNTTLPLSTRS